jgi:hypothetical protein
MKLFITYFLLAVFGIVLIGATVYAASMNDVPQVEGGQRSKMQDAINSAPGNPIRGEGVSIKSSNSTSYVYVDWDRSFMDAPNRMYDYFNSNVTGAGIVASAFTPLISGVTWAVTNPVVRTEGYVPFTDGLGFTVNKYYDPNVSSHLADLRAFDIDIATSSTNIEFACKADSVTTGSVRVMMNDKQLGNIITINTGVETNYIAIGQFTDGEKYREFKLQCSGTIHPWKITVCNSNQVFHPINAPLSKKRLFVLGDSSGANYGVSGVSAHMLPRIVGHCLNYDTYSLGYGSSGFSSMGDFTNMYNVFKLEVDQPGLIRNGDVIWCLGGGTDVAVGLDSANTVKTNALALIDFVRSKYPNSPIWMCPGPNLYDAVPTWYANFSAGISNACLSRNNCYFRNTLYFSTTQTNRIAASSQPGHYNVYGQMEAAANVLKDLRNVLNPTP